MKRFTAHFRSRRADSSLHFGITLSTASEDKLKHRAIPDETYISF
jgi:hypothetical protein